MVLILVQETIFDERTETGGVEEVTEVAENVLNMKEKQSVPVQPGPAVEHNINNLVSD